MNPIDYMYNQPLSLQAVMMQFIIRRAGMKKKTENKIIANGFAGKPEKPTRSVKQKFEVQEIDHIGRKVWTLSPKEDKSDIVILYLHGGAYMANIIRQHWELIEQLIIHTKADIVLPDYPLAPEAGYKETYAFIDELYERILAENPEKRIIIIGDSAGGGLAFGFIQQLRNEEKRQPEQIILFSPWLDVSMSNAGMIPIEKEDNILSIKGLKIAGQKYAGTTDLKDFHVSPLYGNLKGLCKVSFFTGTNDILYADALKLKQLMNEQGLDLNCFVYPRLFHDWVIFTLLKESADAVSKVKDLIK
jgi:epsilon-lactone hydrolase